MSKALSLALYNAVLPFGLVAMAPGALVKMRRRGGRWQDFSQRLGFYDQEKLRAMDGLPQGRGRFWIHAVSVGEVNVAQKLIKKLLAADAGCGVLLTTTTPTGYQLACDFATKNAGRVVAIYSPVDLPFVARRALDEIRPACLVLVEAEVWPNLLRAAKERGIPVALVNARLSERSERRYKLLGDLVRPVFGMLDEVLAQEPEDVERWAALSVARERIHRIGSVKYDPDGAHVSEAKVAELRDVLARLGWNESRPVMIAASTHAGEELEIARVFQRLRKKVRGLMLLIVPRHIERTVEIAAQLRQIGLSPALRTDIKESSDIMIVNTTGELGAWQHLASVVVIGKSFLAKGGQNPAEALMARKPVIYGPHMENFEPLVAALAHCDGARRVADFASLEAMALRLLTEPEVSAQIAARGHDSLARHEGATARTVERLMNLISTF